MRPTILVVVVAITLTGALVTASAFALTRAPKEPTHSWSVNIAVVGDSYSAGSNNGVVWPTLLAQRTGWSVANFALPGAGFAADGQGGQAFTSQVDRAQGAHPRTIVIVGGLADQGFADTGLGMRLSKLLTCLSFLQEIKIIAKRNTTIGVRKFIWQNN